MENGDSAHSEHTHRSSNDAGHDFVHGTWTVQFLRKPLPDPSPKREGLYFINNLNVLMICCRATSGRMASSRGKAGGLMHATREKPA